MIFLIYSLEFLLLLSIAALFFCVIRAYRADLAFVQRESVIGSGQAELKQVSIVENYIEGFFNVESEEQNPLFALRGDLELQTPVNVQVNDESRSQSISSKVVEAMMSEAELVCAS